MAEEGITIFFFTTFSNLKNITMLKYTTTLPQRFFVKSNCCHFLFPYVFQAIRKITISVQLISILDLGIQSGSRCPNNTGESYIMSVKGMS